MPRIFLAIDLPEAARHALRRVRPTASAGVRPVQETQLHLTLHFLGDVPAAQVPRLTSDMAGVVFSPFSLSITGVGRFPPKGRASVLWAGVSACAALRELHASLGQALTAAGYAIERRPYTPHVTLARLTPQAPRNVTDAFLAEHTGLCLPAFEVTSFVVYESQRHHGRSHHMPLVRVAAAAPD